MHSKAILNNSKKRENILQKYTEELQRRNKELDEFTYVASHDLLEPLNKLTAFVKLLEKDMQDKNCDLVKKDMFYINDSSERMRILLRDLLSLSRAAKGNLNLRVIGILSGSPPHIVF